MMHELLQNTRKEGLVALETEIEDFENSPLFTKYPDFVPDHHAVPFVWESWHRCWQVVIAMGALGGSQEEIEKAETKDT